MCSSPRLHQRVVIGFFCLGIVACGGGGGGGESQSPSIAAPSELSYPSPSMAIEGSVIALNPSVTGTVASYLVDPSLPAGLTLSGSTGVIAGTPTAVAPQATYTITASNVSGSTTYGLVLSVQSVPTVQISVAASGQSGDTLSYQWGSTDGVIQNVNSSQTTWTAPFGPGLHFVYVMVSNGKGGYTEGRIAVNTDNIGGPDLIPPAMQYQAPADSGPSGVPFRIFVTDAPSAPNPPLVNMAAPNVVATVGDATLTTDNKGSVAFQNLPVNTNTGLVFSFTFPGVGGAYSVNAQYTVFADSSSNYGVFSVPLAGSTSIVPSVVGSVFQEDGTPSGITEPFFGLSIAPNVTLTSTTCAAISLCSSSIANDYGDFTVPVPGCTASKLTLAVSSENSTPLQVSVPCSAVNLADGFSVGALTLPGTISPTISTMSATFNGASVGTFLPNPIYVPSDSSPRPSETSPQLAQKDIFLAFKGSDGRLGACMYYQAIGAVPAGGCGLSGNYSSAINFEDWKRTVQIDSYAAAGAKTVTATYLNVVDLNLTRVHHSITYGTNQTAAYVCNHAGPVDSNGNAVTVNLPASTITPVQQQAVDTAIGNAVSGKNLVACVAMDYMSTAANGGQPFTRFLIFGPSGALLPSVNLDGRGEKFVPGACIACHGGDNYAGSFPVDGTGNVNVGGHWLPYDAGNFAFSSQAGLTDPDQELSIYSLNQIVLNTAPTPATQNLIGVAGASGWYHNGVPDAATGMPQLDQNFVSSGWCQYANGTYANGVCTNASNQNLIATYQNVIARNCRTCHAALPFYNWDAAAQGLLFYAQVVCGGSPNKFYNHAMPNSLVTFNRLWTFEAQSSAFTSYFGSGCSFSTGP